MAVKHTIYIGLIFLCACANVVSPTGGDKDTSPPKVVETAPKNKTINFSETNVLIVFDELIQINNKENLFISPYTQNIAQLSVSKNKLRISFENQLTANTTYSLNLNGVIKDVNEGNVLTQMNYLFSTGLIIDTLSISGIVLDAATSKPLDNVWVGLYRNEEDSLLYRRSPEYIVKSTESGLFTFSNLPLDTFMLFGIEDLDNNLRYSIPNEKIGFHTGKVVSQTKDIEIRLFDETALADTVKPIEKDSSIAGYGKLIIDSLPQHTPLIVELLYNDILILRKAARQPTIIDSLAAGSYTLRVIEDKNNNGVWDSGKLISKNQAEKVQIYPKEIKIRENWDVLIDWDVN